ncbi:hypothetical protein Glove_52g89 [Diversispora epigaea]|uniref:RNase H type-1 domain-containing protein n=1 Tax=Diversispora epigaea TaxID=1348612 RepID=A0A397JN24_9GLOM|nr:hypothetical protein Glove_52g89 [Diversispora epigaea]
MEKRKGNNIKEEESTVTSNIAGSSNHRNEEIIGCNILEDISLNIKKWISGDKGKLIELTMIKDKLKLRNHIKVYTDGSLLNKLWEDIMGFGWVIPEIQDYERLTFRDNIREFPSSTRAELLAILTCLLVMPDKATVNIYTDSLCALQNMNIIKKKSGKRIWKHCKNPVILQIISEIIKEKDLKVNCYKVKAHSGEKFNEIADALAQIPPSLCRFYNDRFEEIPIKEAAKEIHRVKTMIDWKFQERFKHFMNNLHQPNLYEDSECIFCSPAEEDSLHVFTCKRGGEEDPMRELCVKFKVILREKIIQNKPNIEDLIITCLNYCEIPIKEAAKEIHRVKTMIDWKFQERFKHFMNNLHQPNLYEDSECIFCSPAEEDSLHVFTCKRGGEEDPMRELCVKFKVILREKIIQNKPNIEDLIITCLNYCGEVDYHSTKHGPYLTFFEIIKGFVPDLLTYKVTEICKDKRRAK